ncbi:MAG: sodium-dependent transporter [Gammaproteobacteria bacterium]
MAEQQERFSSRWGIILASLGMAIGAGNLWRFPRLAGEYGGSFLLLWILFLLVWSIPILLIEFGLGKKHKQGVIGAFGNTLGKRYTWVGFFVTVCTLGICFYYSVVTGWGLQYLAFSIKNAWAATSGGATIGAALAQDPEFLTTHWTNVANGNLLTVVLYAVVVAVAIFVLTRGIRNGLERANRVLIPSLFVLLFIVMGVALNMDNGVKGLEYLFRIDPAHFSNPKIWIEALSQSAWSTGAGWGLMMTISSYSREREDVTLNIFIGAFGNNTASIVAAMAILPSVFALAATDAQAISYLQSGNQALTFSVIPRLFDGLPGGHYLAIVFFLAFVLAAFSSLLPMIELFIRNLCDLGLTRNTAAVRAGFFVVLFGFPSAWNLDFFSNQDWVWGIGLILSGLFFLLAAFKAGLLKFKHAIIDKDSDFRVPDAYFAACISLNVVLAVVLVVWWMSRGYSANPWFDENGNWSLFDVYSNASVVTQWAAVLIIGIILNGFLYKRFAERKA